MVTERADSSLAVTVRQIIRTLDGQALSDGEVVKAYQLGQGLIRRMDVEQPEQWFRPHRFHAQRLGDTAGRA